MGLPSAELEPRDAVDGDEPKIELGSAANPLSILSLDTLKVPGNLFENNPGTVVNEVVMDSVLGITRAGEDCAELVNHEMAEFNW